MEGIMEKESEVKTNYRNLSPVRPVIHKLKDHLKVLILCAPCAPNLKVTVDYSSLLFTDCVLQQVLIKFCGTILDIAFSVML